MDQPPGSGATDPRTPDTGAAPDSAREPGSAPAPRRGAELRTFLIADIRGYTSYTEEQGDEAAAALAAEFAALVEQIAGEFEGVLLEVRGDEALAVFFSARQALRAAVELQARSASLARPIGIGLDAGEAIPVGNGYRGTALNVAARLCAQAKGGDIVASEAVIHMAARIDGVVYVEPRTIRLKGLEEAIRAVTVVPEAKVGRRRPRGARRRGIHLDRRLLASLLGGVVVVGVVALVATGALGPGPFAAASPSPTPRPAASQLPADVSVAAPAFALLDTTAGTVAKTIPARSPGDLAVFAEGAFWQLETEPVGILRIDPATGATQTIELPIRDPAGFTVDGTTLWVTDRQAPRVARIDTITGTELPDQPELRLTSDTSDLRGAGDVVIADGSAWVTRPDPGEVIRLDPVDRRVIRSYPIVGADRLALDGDVLWVLSRDGRLSSIDLGSGERSDIRLQLPSDEYDSLAVGGGSVWTAGRRKGTVYRITRTGQLDQSFETGAGAQTVSFADGTLWVGDQHAGTVGAITALTGDIRHVGVGNAVVGVVAGAGRVLVGVVPAVDPFAGLEGTTLYVAMDGDPLAIFDPPASYTWEAAAVIDATCAKLLRAPDRPAPDGWTLEPEIAAELPTLSDDRRTYSFRIRDGFTFYPSGEPITAETMRQSIERAMSYEGTSWILRDIKGAGAFYDAGASHVEGIAVDGDRLSITLQSPDEDFLTRLSLTQVCPVPPSIRAVPPGGFNPASGLPGTGPYYLAAKERDDAILKRNPTYAGSRKAAYDNIAIVLNQDVRASIKEVDEGRLDYLLTYGDDALAPDGDLARSLGPGSAEQRYFNTSDGSLIYLGVDSGVDPSIRRAIALAIDRPRLAATLGGLPTDQLLTPRTRGYDLGRARPGGPDVDAARALLAGRSGEGRLAYDSGCEPCAAAAQIVVDDLAAIGLTVHPEAADDLQTAGAELTLWETGYEDTDPVRYLDNLPSHSMGMYMSPENQAAVNQLGFLTGQERIDAAVALADLWASDEAIMVPISDGVSREYFSSHVGCQTFPPTLYSVDLVALCPK